MQYTDSPYGILDRWTAELSYEQMIGIWRKTDNLVTNYVEPQFEFAIVPNPAIVRAIIDDEFYWSMFFGEEYHRSHNFNFRRRDRIRYEITDRNLLILTHYLADLAPIRMGWEPLEFLE